MLSAVPEYGTPVPVKKSRVHHHRPVGSFLHEDNKKKENGKAITNNEKRKKQINVCLFVLSSFYSSLNCPRLYLNTTFTYFRRVACQSLFHQFHVAFLYGQRRAYSIYEYQMEPNLSSKRCVPTHIHTHKKVLSNSLRFVAIQFRREWVKREKENIMPCIIHI